MKDFKFTHGMALALLVVAIVAGCFSPLRHAGATDSFIMNSVQYMQDGDIATIVLVLASLLLFTGFVYSQTFEDN